MTNSTTYSGKKHSCMLYQLVPMGCTSRTRNEPAAMVAMTSAAVMWTAFGVRAATVLGGTSAIPFPPTRPLMSRATA